MIEIVSQLERNSACSNRSMTAMIQQDQLFWSELNVDVCWVRDKYCLLLCYTVTFKLFCMAWVVCVWAQCQSKSHCSYIARNLQISIFQVQDLNGLLGRQYQSGLLRPTLITSFSQEETGHQ